MYKLTRIIIALLMMSVTYNAYAVIPLPLPPATTDAGRAAQYLSMWEHRVRTTDFQLKLPIKPKQPKQKHFRSFKLSAVHIKGMTKLFLSDVENYYHGYLEHTVTLHDLHCIARLIEERYAREGYPLTRVVIPKQSFKHGVVVIQVMEPYIGETRVCGDMPANLHHLILGYIENAASVKPLEHSPLIRYLLLIQDLVGINAHAELTYIDEQSAAMRLTVFVETFDYRGRVSIDNRGNRFFGRVRGDIAGTVYHLGDLFPASATSARYVSSTSWKRFHYVGFAHQHALGTHGLQLHMTADDARTRPNFTRVYPFVTENSVDGVTRGLNIDLVYPYWRHVKRNLYFQLEFSARNDRDECDGMRLFEDRLRSLRFAAYFDYADEWRGVSMIGLQLSQGLNAVGAGAPRPSRPGARVDYLKFNAIVSRHQQFPYKLSLYAEIQVQLDISQSGLLINEELGYGGSRIGRGYDESELVGDHGVIGMIELRYDPLSQYRWINHWQPFIFFDAGAVWNEDRTLQPRHSDASSAGIGVRATMRHNLSGYVYLAKPLTRDVVAEASRAPRIFLGASWAV